MVSVVLSLGSNCGNRQSQIEGALDWLKETLMQTEASSIYETPCAMKAGRPYLNAVVKGFFSGTGEELEDLLKEKEKEMGRTSKCRERGDVPIDIDIVVMNGGIVREWDFRQKFFQQGYSELIF